jgi:hypothetical protein
MIKTRTEKETIEVEIIEDVLCDKCEKSIMLSDIGGPEDGSLLEGVAFEMSFGYGSCQDGEYYKVCLCDDCAGDFLDSLKTFT